MPAAVLWDMDGTIIDSEPAWVHAEKELLAEYGSEVTAEDLNDWVGIGLWNLARVFQTRGVSLSEDEIVYRLTDRVNEIIFASEPEWRPGAIELIAEFKGLGIPNSLVTMATRGQAEMVVSHLPSGSFESITAGEDVRNPKPHPEPYLLGASRVGAPAGRCIAIEDSPTGVTAAAAAGSFVVAVPHLVDLSETPSNIVLGSLANVAAYDILEAFSEWSSAQRFSSQ